MYYSEFDKEGMQTLKDIGNCFKRMIQFLEDIKDLKDKSKSKKEDALKEVNKIILS